MLGQFIIGPSLAEWIRSDCRERPDFDHTLTGFSVLANQEISGIALSLLEDAIDLIEEESQGKELARELSGISHPYAELYDWMSRLRIARAPNFERCREVLGKWLLPWSESRWTNVEPFQSLLKAELFAGEKR